MQNTSRRYHTNQGLNCTRFKAFVHVARESLKNASDKATHALPALPAVTYISASLNACRFALGFMAANSQALFWSINDTGADSA